MSYNNSSIKPYSTTTILSSLRNQPGVEKCWVLMSPGSNTSVCGSWGLTMEVSNVVLSPLSKGAVLGGHGISSHWPWRWECPRPMGGRGASSRSRESYLAAANSDYTSEYERELTPAEDGQQWAEPSSRAGISVPSLTSRNRVIPIVQRQNVWCEVYEDAENARLENAGRSKMQGWKMQDWKMRDRNARVEMQEHLVWKAFCKNVCQCYHIAVQMC